MTELKIKNHNPMELSMQQALQIESERFYIAWDHVGAGHHGRYILSSY